jgi:hypothetical protein
MIEIEGSGAPGGTDGLTVSGSDVTVRGFVINRFPGDGVHVVGASGVRIECNFVGTDAAGTQGYGNGGVGIRLIGSSDSPIGAYNLISANAVAGILIDATSSDNRLSGNRIGTDGAALAPLGNLDGVVVRGANNLIDFNVISGNLDNGIVIDGATATGNRVTSNAVGAAFNGIAPFGNGGAGLYLENGASQNIIGESTYPFPDNSFRENGASGVRVVGDTTIDNSIRGNFIGQNGGIGIDLGDVSANPNDPDDPDVGPNRLQNAPELAPDAYLTGSGLWTLLTVTFSVPTSPANATYPLLVDVYLADVDAEEGTDYLGTISYGTADFAAGALQRTFTIANPVGIGDYIVATATDSAGNTSEFNSAAATVAPEPSSALLALAAGGTLVLQCRAKRRAAARGR